MPYPNGVGDERVFLAQNPKFLQIYGFLSCIAQISLGVFNGMLRDRR